DATGYDHAGKYECALLQALYPDAVVPERIDTSEEWFIQSAREATPALGEEMLRQSIADLLERI
ncbi:MAG: hypothetical protein RR482_06920, partial [Clostridia bacterium]